MPRNYLVQHKTRVKNTIVTHRPFAEYDQKIQKEKEGIMKLVTFASTQEHTMDYGISKEGG
jgi:hypothetical protein